MDFGVTRQPIRDFDRTISHQKAKSNKRQRPICCSVSISTLRDRSREKTQTIPRLSQKLQLRQNKTIADSGSLLQAIWLLDTHRWLPVHHQNKQNTAVT